MNQSEWRKCDDPQVMLNWLHEQGRFSERKGRLFAVACCRRVWPLFTDERSRKAVEVAELLADGLAEDQRAVLDAALDVCMEDLNDAELMIANAATATLEREATHAAECTANFIAAIYAVNDTSKDETWRAGWDSVKPIHAALLRDISNPFRPVSFHPAWRTANTLMLATNSYERGTFDKLPDMAQALANAGCADAELLEHLRGPGPHVKGCWAVDAVLGRE